MRTFAASGMIAAALALAAPMGATPATTPDDTPAVEQQPAAVAVQQMTVALPGLRDEVAMVLVGTALIGLGAVVRRAA